VDKKVWLSAPDQWPVVQAVGELLLTESEVNETRFGNLPESSKANREWAKKGVGFFSTLRRAKPIAMNRKGI